MNWLKRITARLVMARLFKKLEVHMAQPLPKIAGWIGLLGSIGAALTGFAGIIPAKWAAVAAALGTALTALSHSLQGTGGTPDNP